MKSLKLIGLSLLALLALGVFAASASALEGFLPQPAAGTATLLGGESILETSLKLVIKCKELDDSALTFTNDRTATAELHWLGCTSTGFPVNSVGDKPEIILAKVDFLVCLDPKNAKGESVDAMGISGTVLPEAGITIEIPAVASKVVVKGRALGAFLTSGTAKLFIAEFKNSGTAGEQAVKTCLQEGVAQEHTLLSSFNGGAFELASEEVKGGLLQFKEAVELMDK